MHRLLRMMTLVAMILTVARCQTITAEAKARVDGKVQRVRKINGRWWTDHNRQVTRTKSGFILTGGVKSKSWTFHHHRPVNLELAESLHRRMTPASVRELLGEPNQTAPGNGSGSRLWMYYAENGTALRVRFMRDELADAHYQRPDYGVSGKPVQSVAQDSGRMEVVPVMSGRAGARSQSVRSTISVIAAQSSLSPPDPPQRRIALRLADAVRIGMPKAEVMRLLGEPSGGMHVAGGENDFEVMTYSLTPSGEVSLRLEQGKVVQMSR